MSATTMSNQRTRQQVSPPGFGATLASEWTKMTSVRSTWITIALALILSIGTTALVALVIGATWNDWTPQDQAAFDPVTTSFAGLLFGSIVVAVLAVNLVTSEYGSGMMSLTLTATPKRGRVLAAKMLLVAAVTLMLGLMIMIGNFFAAQLMFQVFDLPAAGLFDDGVPRAILGTALLSPLFPIIGAAFGFILRSTAGGITAVLALIWVPEIVGAFMPRWWRENVFSLLPGSAADTLSLSHILDSPTYLDSMPLAALVVVAWLVLFTGSAYLALQKRDA
jgi:ABC-2 type transport system permease protein